MKFEIPWPVAIQTKNSSTESVFKYTIYSVLNSLMVRLLFRLRAMQDWIVERKRHRLSVGSLFYASAVAVAPRLLYVHL